MKYFWYILGIGWIGVAVIVLALVANLVQQDTVEFTDDLEIDSGPSISPNDPVRGNLAGGKIAIISFSNFSCTNCKEMNETISDLLQLYGEDVIHVWKDLPNPSINPESQRAAVAARCAQKQGEFWEYHDLLFTHQDSQEADLYLAIAQELQLNTNSFERCVAKEKTLSLLSSHVEEADQLNIISAPTVFIGERRFTGSVALEQLESALVSQLDALTTNP